MNSVPTVWRVFEVPTQDIIPRPTNWTAIVFVAFVFLSYAALAGVLHSDASPPEKSGHIVLLEQLSPRHHFYLVLLRTGPYFHAGTSASVSAVLLQS